MYVSLKILWTTFIISNYKIYINKTYRKIGFISLEILLLHYKVQPVTLVQGDNQRLLW
jgi:hypothetical protein